MKYELGKFLKTCIINAGISQKDFAQKLDLSPTALSQIITGKVKPRQATISKIMEFLNFNMIIFYYNYRGERKCFPLDLKEI